QTDILPALAAVLRAIDAVAVADAPLAVVLSRADPDDIGILGIKHHGANGIGTFVIKNRRPGGPGVFRFPNAARGDRHIIMSAVVRMDREAHDSSRGN